MALLEITQTLGLKLKVYTLNFGEVELKIIDPASLAGLIGASVFTVQLDINPSGQFVVNRNWQNVPALANQFVQVGSNPNFSLNASTGEMTCLVAGDYLAQCSLGVARGAPVDAVAAFSKNDDVPLGTEDFVKWQVREHGDSATGGRVVLCPARRVTLAATDVLKLVGRNHDNTGVPGMTWSTVQINVTKLNTP